MIKNLNKTKLRYFGQNRSLRILSTALQCSKNQPPSNVLAAIFLKIIIL